MPQVGWRDPSNGQERTFEEVLADAAVHGEALGLPYEVLAGIAKQLDKSDRPDGFSATMLAKCARAVWLDKTAEYYSDPMSNYPAFRGTIGHSILEANPHPSAVVEHRLFRQYRGETLSGQLDKVRVAIPGATPEEEKAFLDEWLDWCSLAFAAESLGADVADAPSIPEGARFLIEDWKTKHDVPFGIYVYDHHKKQGNIYRWLLRIPTDVADIRFVYVSMEAVKPLMVYNGGKFANGRERPVQVMTDSEVEAYLDDRLRTLALQRKLGRPLPYAKVPTDDLWECNYCPIKDMCYSEAAKEARAEFEKGNDVDRIPPRSKKDEEKVRLPGRKKAETKESMAEPGKEVKDTKPKRTRKPAAKPPADQLPF